MKTLWCKNEENPSDRISHAWAPLNFWKIAVKIMLDPEDCERNVIVKS